MIHQKDGGQVGKTISHYKILEKLGEGGMGVVYKAQDTKLKRTVALKFLPPELTRNREAKERFVREAQAASALDHPNICTIHEIDEANDQTFIAMACIDGPNLKERIQAGPLKLDETLDIAIQVACGLQVAHEKGIVHRDLKSGNVMLTSQGQAKIMDFGLAKSRDQATITRTGTTMGTPAYMSPEQARGEEVDHRTDIWSFGVMLYELITGQLPFKGEHEQAVIYSILNVDPEPITELRKELPGSLQTIVKKSLEKDHTHRYQNMAEILNDLQAVKKGFPVTKKPPIKRKKDRIIKGAILISVAVVLALILMVLLTRHKEEQIPGKISKIPVGVMFFDNQTGEDKYDYLRKVLADMLITDLGQSRYLQVMAFPRMFDLLKSLGYEDVEIIDASLGFELCKLAQAHVMVLGSLTKSGDTFVINTQVLDVDTKVQIAAYRVTGKGEDSILGHLVDDLTDEIKRGMEVSIRGIQQEKKNITELTTTSLEAYKYYFAGREAAYRMYHQEAIDNYEKAVALDSAFIEAYERLARQYHETHEFTKALKIIEKIKSFSGKLAEEKLVEILALEAYIKHDWDLAINYYKRLISINPENMGAHIDLGMVYYQRKMMYDEGISEFKKALELDPQGITRLTSFTYNVLGWVYLRKGSKEKAQVAFEKYVALLPNQPNPLNCLGEFHLFAGNYDQAIMALQQSLKIKSDFPVTYGDLGDTYLAKGIFSQALRSYERFLALSLSEAEQAEGHFYLSKLYYLKSDYGKAIQECQQALGFNPQMIEAHWIQGLTFVEKEIFDQAESEVLSIKGLIEKTKTEKAKTYYYHLSGELFLSRGFYQQALENFNQAIVIWSLERTFYVNALGEAYFKIGELDKAVEKLEAVLEINPNYAQTHFLLGLVYEKKGKKEKARQHFQRFIAIWKDADENLPQLIDAKKRLEEL
jgi:serine/threonine protein kinase/tetratricopeptide (TPR) repeat protein